MHRGRNNLHHLNSSAVMATGGQINPNEALGHTIEDYMLSRKLQSSSVASLSPEEARVKDMLTQSASIKN